MRRLLLVVCLLCSLSSGAPAAHAAVAPIGSYLNACPAYGDVRVCSGEAPSFDGSKLDFDLTLPAGGGAATHPLIVMLHGFGNNKHEWESVDDAADGADKWHWNSHWFAEHGYYVLTYTARGFRDDGPGAPYQPQTPGGSSAELPNGTIHLKSREFEVRDTQWLAALVAAGFADVDARRVAVSGGSYGGGESWLQASQARWTFPHERDPALPVLDLQVAVPKYPWTDLAYSLAPNGHPGPGTGDLYSSSQGRPDSDSGDGNPLGVLKLSYTTGLFALGNARGIFEAGTTTTPSEEGPISVPAWAARAGGQGDPYDVAGVEDPLVRQIRRGLTELRGAYYQDEGWRAQAAGREVAVFSISGWSDDLFPPVESFRMFKYLKAIDRLWPVAVAVGDVGHARAQNRPATWRRFNDQAWQFLQAQISGSHRQQTTVTSEPQLCPGDGDPGSADTAAMALTATTPEGLARGELTIDFARGGAMTSTSGLGDLNGPATDPVAGGSLDPLIAPSDGCRTSPGPATGGYTVLSEPLPAAATYVGLGYVRVPYQLAGGPTATLLARVWDVAPGGRTLLVTRGAYRIDAPAYDSLAGVLRLPLYGNHWPLAPGHRLRLDLTQVDQPSFRPGSAPSALRFDAPRLVLPLRQAVDRRLAGA